MAEIKSPKIPPPMAAAGLLGPELVSSCLPPSTVSKLKLIRAFKSEEQSGTQFRTKSATKSNFDGQICRKWDLYH